METQQAQTETTQATKTAKTKRKSTKVTAKTKSARIKARTGGKKSKVTGPSVAFNVSVPAKDLPKIDKAARIFAKKNNLSRTSRSAWVRQTLLKAVRG